MYYLSILLGHGNYPENQGSLIKAKTKEALTANSSGRTENKAMGLSDISRMATLNLRGISTLQRDTQ